MIFVGCNLLQTLEHSNTAKAELTGERLSPTKQFAFMLIYFNGYYLVAAYYLGAADKSEFQHTRAKIAKFSVTILFADS